MNLEHAYSRLGRAPEIKKTASVAAFIVPFSIITLPWLGCRIAVVCWKVKSGIVPRATMWGDI